MLACTLWHHSPSAEADSYACYCSPFGALTWGTGLQTQNQLRNAFDTATVLPSPAELSMAVSQSDFDAIDTETENQSRELDDSDSRAASYTGREQHDSGLGITTNEGIYSLDFHTTSTCPRDPAIYIAPNLHPSTYNYKSLSSPFEEHMYTPASIWTHGVPLAATCDADPSTYSSATAPQTFYPDIQYSIPPSAYTRNIPQRPPVSSDASERPHIRGCSMPPVVKQETPSRQLIPASIDQWAAPYSATESHYANYSNIRPPNCTEDQQKYQAADVYYSTSSSPRSTRAAMTVPFRRKPRMRPSLSESCVPQLSSSARLRAATTDAFLQTPQFECGTASMQRQLQLPPLPPSMLVDPHTFITTSPQYLSRLIRSTSTTPIRRNLPVSPPASDFIATCAPYLVPVRQDPTFKGDLYTPRYKRRSPSGRWEGWCGYCQPGRWLDLKNSRYWEDKLRNHGICAKTKLKFMQPVKIRRVSLDGSIVTKVKPGTEVIDPYSDQTRREGLCGTCGSWIVMDGLRTKIRDRAVGWWTHAYKCHDHDQSRDETTISALAEASLLLDAHAHST